MPLPYEPEPPSRYAKGERARAAARDEAERRDHARLVEAEQRAAAAMEELARVHAELNGWKYVDTPDVSDGAHHPPPPPGYPPSPHVAAQHAGM